MWKKLITLLGWILLAECFLSQPGWALDWLVFNTVSPDDAERKANEAVAEQYMKDFRENYPDLTIITIKNGRSQVTYESENATGKNRIIYVDGSTNSKQFLQHINGSSDTDVDRSDKNRKIKDILFLGHGSAGGPQTFTEEIREDTHGAMAWQKNFTDWERKLAKEGKNPSDFFCKSPTITFGNCNVGTSVFPNYVANILPSEGEVYAADTLVDAGSPGWFGRKDLYLYKEGKSVPFPVFRPGDKGKTNSELTLESELLFLYNEIKQTRDLFSGVTEQNKSGFLIMFAKYYTDVKDFEPGNVRDELVKIINNLQSKVRDLTLTRGDLDAFLKEIKNLRKGKSAENSSAVAALRKVAEGVTNANKKKWEAWYADEAARHKYMAHYMTCSVRIDAEMSYGRGRRGTAPNPCPTCKKLLEESNRKHEESDKLRDEYYRIREDYSKFVTEFGATPHPELAKKEITTTEAWEKYKKDYEKKHRPWTYKQEEISNHTKRKMEIPRQIGATSELLDANLGENGDTAENRALLKKLNGLYEEKLNLEIEDLIEHAEFNATEKFMEERQ
jgi:hypothetical protein